MGNFAWLIAPVLTVLACLAADRIGAGLGLLDHPDGGRKRHERSTPLIGGLVVVVPWSIMLIVLSIFAPLYGPLPILVLVGILFLAIGLIDDRFGLAPRHRLLAGLVVVLAFATLVPDFRIDALRTSLAADPVILGPVLGVAFTALAVVGFVNAVNMADGIDGLVPGLWAIWTAGALVLAPPGLAPALAMLLASVLIVTLFNWRGRLFLGDAGAYAGAALVGFVAILLYNEGAAVGMTAGTAVTWFLIPVLDCLRLAVRRARDGRSPFAADRDHLHHRLEHRFGRRRAVLIYWTIVAIPVGLTLPEAVSGSLAVALPAALYIVVLRLSAPIAAARGERELRHTMSPSPSVSAKR